MKKAQFKIKGSIKPVKNPGVEITGKVLRTKRWEEKTRVQKMPARDENGYGDFEDTIQHDNDFEDDVRGYGNFRRASGND